MNRRQIYKPAWWLPGGHLQTIWAKFARRRRELRLIRDVWPTPDGDVLEIYRSSQPDERTPRVIVFHGLEGSLRSHYANGILSAANDARWAADFVAFRSCGTELNRTRRFYHSGDIDEVHFAVTRVADEFPRTPIFLFGVSLGGNVLLKYLGDRAGLVANNVVAAAAVSVPYDLGLSAQRINHGFSRLYQRFFLTTLKRKVDLKRERFPDLPTASEVKRIRNMVDFDELITAPLHGFAGADDYYARSSAIRSLDQIRVPTLLLSAYDDPFLPVSVLEAVARKAEGNPFLHIEFHRCGGHVGFVSGRFPWSAEYHMDKAVVQFFRSYTDAPTSR